MRVLPIFIFGVSFCVIVSAHFAYERGKCDAAPFSVFQDMIKNELRGLVNPEEYYSQNKKLRYELYTRRNPFERQILKLRNPNSLRNSNFNASWPVRFSIHGWAGKSTICSNAAIKDAYLSIGDFNVIIVDWSEYSLDISYARLSKQIPAIAASLAKFINFLQSETGITYEQIYLIGHSAGSHISGFVGKILKPQRLGAIFALDPAGLSQLGLSAEFRLAPNDARYVESIHSDVVLLGNPSTELSQASFFANWGQGQPQCPNATTAEFDFACDHFAALYYFAESLRNPKLFGAIQCPNMRSIEQFNCNCTTTNYRTTSRTDTANNNNSTSDILGDDDYDNDSNDICAAVAYMGGEPATPKTGIYYFSTSPRPPFGLGQEVRVRRPIRPNYLRSSFLSQRIIDKIRYYN